MTDRELLELAAKAIGKELAWSEVEGVSPLMKHGPGVRGLGEKWNPLESDGDALRLAVDLGLSVSTSSDRVNASKNMRAYSVKFSDYDKHAATRRAIVLAAAEIGREK